MKEIRLDIAGTTYRENAIVGNPSTHRRVFENTTSPVGNCICGELTATLKIPSSDIPRNAEIIPYTRDEGGSWVQKSAFYVFSRSVDKETGHVTLTAYDAIYRAGVSFTQSGDQGTWPRTDLAVMQEIAQRTNTTINADTLAKMDKAYPVPYPGIILSDGTLTPDGRGALTMRDVAGRIAAFYGGNWYIDNSGQWRLWILGDLPADADYLVTENAEVIVMGGVRILVK